MRRRRVESLMKGRSLSAAKNRFVAVWLVPLTLGFIVFRLYPIVYGFYISMFDWDIFVDQQKFVGIANYAREVSTPLFRKMLANTTYFAVVSTLLGGVIGLVVALLLNSIDRYSGLFRTVFFMPVMTSTVAISVVWMMLYQPQFGLFNAILRKFGLKGLSWLRSPSLAMPSIVVMSVWQGLGFTIILLLAGLKNIPSQLYEAAAIDGANGWDLFRRITLPCLRPVLLFVVVTGIMGGFKAFEQIYVMTEGGPLNATRVLAFHIYQLAFWQLAFGRGAALAFVLFAIVLVLTVLQMRVGRTEWEF